MSEYPPAVRAAMDRLGAASEALSVRARLDLARFTLARVSAPDAQPQERPLWRAVHHLTEGATEQRLGEMASVLEVVGPDVRRAVAIVADEASRADPPRRDWWAALGGLARSMGGS